MSLVAFWILFYLGCKKVLTLISQLLLLTVISLDMYIKDVYVMYLQRDVCLNKATSVRGFRSHIADMVFTVVHVLIFNNVNIMGIMIHKFWHAILCTDYISLFWISDHNTQDACGLGWGLEITLSYAFVTLNVMNASGFLWACQHAFI